MPACECRAATICAKLTRNGAEGVDLLLPGGLAVSGYSCSQLKANTEFPLSQELLQVGEARSVLLVADSFLKALFPDTVLTWDLVQHNEGAPMLISRGQELVEATASQQRPVELQPLSATPSHTTLRMQEQVQLQVICPCQHLA